MGAIWYVLLMNHPHHPHPPTVSMTILAKRSSMPAGWCDTEEANNDVEYDGDGVSGGLMPQEGGEGTTEGNRVDFLVNRGM